MSIESGTATLWRTSYEPLPDITAWEVAIDRKYINRSQIVASYDCDKLGTSLRHRVDDDSHRRMDEVWREYISASEAAKTGRP